MLVKPRFNWDMTDRYVEMLNCQQEVMNMLETSTYKITDWERILVIKIWLGWESLLIMETFMQEEKRKM